MNLEKQKAFLIHFAYMAVLFILAYVGLKYLMPLLMPFVIGMVIAFLLRPMIDTIQRKIHIKRSFISIIIVILFYSIIVLIISLFGVKLFSFLKDVFNKLPDLYRDTIEPALNKNTSDLLLKYPQLEENIEAISTNINDSLSGFLSKASTSVVSTITGFAGQVPAFIIKLLFTIVATFFFTIDFHRITAFILKQFPNASKKLLLQVKDNGIGTLGKFLRAYVTLISITFIELSIGFLILGIPNAILVAVLVAVVDILPILGTGTILLPWAGIAFIIDNSSLGIGLIILYVVITVVRQTLEPRIIGQQIGLHPVVTLICMYVGAQLLGILGLFLLPVIATILKKMNDEGTIHLFK